MLSKNQLGFLIDWGDIGNAIVSGTCQIINREIINKDDWYRPAYSFSISNIWNANIQSGDLFGFESKNNFKHVTNLEIYTQSGTFIKNLKSKRIKLPDHFTLQRNGGIKTIISIEENKIALNYFMGHQVNTL